MVLYGRLWYYTDFYGIIRTFVVLLTIYFDNMLLFGECYYLENAIIWILVIIKHNTVQIY